MEKFKLPLADDVRFNHNDAKEIINILLGENGCPWYRTQTLENLKQYLLDESYEVAEAIENDDMSGLTEEIGDVFHVLFFMIRICENKGLFSIEDTYDGIVRKMTTRNTHIFSDDEVHSSEDVEALYEKNKEKEKKKISLYDKMDSVPKNLPALMRAQKILEKGKHDEPFDEAIDEAVSGLLSLRNMELDEKNIKIGEILLQISYICLYLQINAEFALTNALKTYINKFGNIDKHS